MAVLGMAALGMAALGIAMSRNLCSISPFD